MRVTLFIVCGIALLLTTAFHLDYRLNLTHSEPIGLYKLENETPTRGDLASFCLSPENEYLELSLSRTYLGTSLLCPSGQKPLVKELVGTAGDVVTVHSNTIQVNTTYYRLTARTHDSKGRSLPHKLHSAVIPKGKALLLSTHHQDSFDSRYFGLVDAAALHKVTPIFTFN
ncbi:conjugative transfer signal peptidase TraF [Halodesulfovibrio spirochaetisodalis]|uniref:Signal peptidase I n=1 Tax=Halodesulfovibrio spirochaetisodalis TaxID=1560234 RepID=A0A1B7XAW1_9BACT|nr:conjugative transfer signal peptidase TraF [Halodesulfovibrio spirochaetisodalis]OBQ46476.1 hypothetical protein SP90_12300 [Halodesulfovibrio spirochaetisodalis]